MSIYLVVSITNFAFIGPMPDEEKPVGAKEIAILLGRHRYTINLWARQGLIPSHKMNGRVILFTPSLVLNAVRVNNLERWTGTGQHESNRQKSANAQPK